MESTDFSIFPLKLVAGIFKTYHFLKKINKISVNPSNKLVDQSLSVLVLPIKSLGSVFIIIIIFFHKEMYTFFQQEQESDKDSVNKIF